MGRDGGNPGRSTVALPNHGAFMGVTSQDPSMSVAWLLLRGGKEGGM